MKIVNIEDATAQLSALIDAATHGEGVVIAQDGGPGIWLMPLRDKNKERKPGGMKGEFYIPDDFDSPLPDDIQASFEGR